MKRNISVYLDLLRLLAAIGVFVGHARHILMPSIPVLLGGHASQCVSVFFVLSGLVIAFVVDSKENDWGIYTRARALRMYSVTIVALFVTISLDYFGQNYNPMPYIANDVVRSSFDVVDIISYLTFTHEFWWANRWVGSNEAFWSLGYEVPYYAVFGLYTFLPRKWRWPAVAAACLLIGPRVIAYLPLWLFGVYTYKKFVRQQAALPSGKLAPFIFLLSVFVYFPVRFLIRIPIYNIYETKGLSLFLISWLHFNIVGLCVVTNIVGFLAMTKSKVVWSEGFARIIRWAAGGSFSLYLIHQPAMFFLAALIPNVTHSAIKGIFAMLLIVAFSYMVAEVGERRKKLILILLRKTI